MSDYLLLIATKYSVSNKTFNIINLNDDFDDETENPTKKSQNFSSSIYQFNPFSYKNYRYLIPL